MILKALEMQGFKSFPDKTLLEFGPGLTAVIGPNGAGKSNISDAVRWVLGEQSSKSLRGARMEDVIFSGTGVRKAQGFAEVTLRLDNTDRSLPHYDKDELGVTRKYYRSGESEYLLNGESVRLKDVHELFMDTGLGRDGYSLVSQGRVADLISSRSGQRREMLEEAAGISHFRYRRTDANRRLEQAEENLLRLRDILSELEGRVGPLKIQSEKAQQYLNLATEKREIEIGLWLHTISQSKAGLKEQEHKLALAALQHEQLAGELEQLAEAIEENYAAGQALTLEIERVRLSGSEHEEQATAIEGQISVEETSIRHNRETIERITKDMEATASTQQHLDEQIGAARQSIAASEAEIETLQENLRELGQQAEAIRQDSLSFSAQAAQLTRQRLETAAALSDKRVAESTALSSAAEIRSRMETVREGLALRGALLRELEQQREARGKERTALREKAEELSNALSGYQMLAESRGVKAEKRKKETESLDLEIRQKSARLKLLDELEKNMEGYSGSVKAVMREARRGTLSGLHGPLSQLISVEETHAVAIETALGASIQHIVTDNENDAKRAIQFLKEQKAGRATFLPLSAIRARAFTEKGVEQCRGFIGMAQRLVSYDPRYEQVVGAQLARTAVVENIDDAVIMAKQYGYRFRIVTRDGQVLNAGGSMTGGSQTQNAGFLSRGNEIEALHKQLQGLREQLTEKQAQYKTAAEEAAAAAVALDGLQAELAIAQEEGIRKESEWQLVCGKAETEESALRELEAERENAARRLEALEADCERLGGEIEGCNAALAQLDEHLQSFETEQQSFTQRLDENAGRAAEHNLRILGCGKDIQARQESIESLERRRGSHTERIGGLNEEISEIASGTRELKARILQLQQQAEALRAKSAETKEAVQALVEQRNEAQAKGTALRTEEREKTATREDLSAELARLESKRDSLHNSMEETLNKLFDEYQLTLREAQDLDIQLETPGKANRRLHEIRAKIRALGTVNVGAVEEYKEVSERYEFLKEQIDDIERSRAELTRLIAELTEQMAARFREQFQKINACFGETFAQLFDGGKAELLLENPAELLESNIEIKVQPPGKNVQNIDLLSGGEKGLSAIALLFAILKVKPAPFCIFDEVEAALDDVNVTRYAQYVRRMVEQTQFILITHRRGTMEEADVLYGVTMQEEGVSKLLRLKTAEMAQAMGF